jgi:hypothetical protein
VLGHRQRVKRPDSDLELSERLRGGALLLDEQAQLDDLDLDLLRQRRVESMDVVYELLVDERVVRT